MPNLFKDGFTNGVTEAPRPTTPEQEEIIAKKVAAGRAQRAERRAKGELPPLAVEEAEPAETLATGQNPTGPTESEALSASVASENVEQVSEDLAAPDDGMTPAELAQLEAAKAMEAERADLMARAKAVNLGAQKNYDAHTSLKMLRRYVSDAESEQRSEQAADEAPPPPSDTAYDAAGQRYQDAYLRLHTLQSEQAGIQGQIDDAVATGDFGGVATLRQRQAALPWLIEIADLDAARLAVPLSELRMARTRFQKKAARMASSQRLEALKKLQDEIWAIRNAEAAADSEHADAVVLHGQALDRVRQLEAQMKQAPPAQHQAPYSWRETGLQGLS